MRPGNRTRVSTHAASTAIGKLQSTLREAISRLSLRASISTGLRIQKVRWLATNIAAGRMLPNPEGGGSCEGLPGGGFRCREHLKIAKGMARAVPRHEGP